MSHKIIYLNGFMASGKSTIGPILANTLGWDYYDLDKVIEKAMGKRISDIFRDEGEEFFRAKERETLLRLSQENKVVISLGGGTSVSDENMRILRETGKIVYLKASPELLFQRLKNKKDRPMVSKYTGSGKKGELLEKIVQLLNDRSQYYEQADVIINTDRVPLGFTVDRIAKLLCRYYEED